jgi:flavin-binding protein dodecin
MNIGGVDMLGIRLGERTREEHEGEVKTASVVKVIEVIGSSPISFDDAIEKAIDTAADSLRHITGADVKHMTVAVKDGKIAGYRVAMKIAFALEDDD